MIDADDTEEFREDAKKINALMAEIRVVLQRSIDRNEAGSIQAMAVILTGANIILSQPNPSAALNEFVYDLSFAVMSKQD